MPTDIFSRSNEGRPAMLAKMRRGLFWTGVLMTLMGAAALSMPYVGSLVIEILVGWLLVISGMVLIFGAFALRGTGLFGWQLVAGVITFALGLMMIAFPTQGLVALTVLVAVSMVLTGIAQIAFAAWLRPVLGWGWGLLSALISIGLGGYILFLLPEASNVLLGLLLGVDFISSGVALMLMSRAVP